MQYLNKIGVNAKRAFENLNKTNHKKIKKVLESYNRSILVNKRGIIKENLKDVKSSKRKGLIDRLILNEKRIDNIIYMWLVGCFGFFCSQVCFDTGEDRIGSK